MNIQVADDVSQTITMIIDSLECSREVTSGLSASNPDPGNNQDLSQCKFHLDAAQALLSYMIRQHFPDNEADEIKFL